MIRNFGIVDNSGIFLSGEEAHFSIPDNFNFVGFFLDTNGKISEFYVYTFGDREYSLSEVKRLGAPILPMYQDLVSSGKYPPFEIFEGRYNPERPTRSFLLSQEIADSTGLPQSFVFGYLDILESLAKGGKIDIVHYNPALTGSTKTEFHPVQAAKDFISAAPAAISKIANVSDTVSKRIVTVSIVGLAVYGLFTANKLIKRRA